VRCVHLFIDVAAIDRHQLTLNQKKASFRIAPGSLRCFFLHFREGLNASKPQHAYTVECTPTSEVNHALRVYVAGSGNNKCGSYQLARSKTPRASVSTQTKPVNKMFELCKPSGR